jgi:hypothetical protein
VLGKNGVVYASACTIQIRHLFPYTLKTQPEGCPTINISQKNKKNNKNIFLKKILSPLLRETPFHCL